MKCRRCDDEAVAVFEFPEGCACSPEQVQALCAQHAFKATPRSGMVLSNDLTVGQEFTRAWISSQLGNVSAVGQNLPAPAEVDHS